HKGDVAAERRFQRSQRQIDLHRRIRRGGQYRFGLHDVIATTAAADVEVVATGRRRQFEAPSTVYHQQWWRHVLRRGRGWAVVGEHVLRRDDAFHSQRRRVGLALMQHGTTVID